MFYLLATTPLLCLLTMGAHFLRVGHAPLVLASLALAVVLFVRRGWARRLVQAALLIGVLEWLWTLYLLSLARARSGRPSGRLGLILGLVAAVTLLSALLLQLPPARRWYGAAERAGEKPR